MLKINLKLWLVRLLVIQIDKNINFFQSTFLKKIEFKFIEKQ